MPLLVEEIIRHRLATGRSFPAGQWCAWCVLDEQKIFLGAHDGGWVNVFAPSRLRAGIGPYSEFAYSPFEQRWAYGNRPYGASRIEGFIGRQVQMVA
jgi:hypothetical protein